MESRPFFVTHRFWIFVELSGQLLFYIEVVRAKRV